jgi:hypothetical protein
MSPWWRRGALTMLLAAVLPAAAGDGPWLGFHGGIDGSLGYRIDVEFTTSVNQRSCQFADYITGMWVPLRESVSLTPRIEAGSHYVRVPLVHPGGAGECGWTPAVLSLCAGPAAGDASQYRCHALYVMQRGNDGPPADRKLSCSAGTSICTAPDGTAIDAQRISLFDREVRIDIDAAQAKLPAQ